MANNSSRTKVITGTGTRLSYFHGWEPVSINGGAEKYSVSVLIPKSDTETVSAINAAIDAAIEEGVAKFGGKKPNKAAIKLPLRDGDVERDDEAYKGHYFINANSTTAPQIVDRQVKPILDRSEVYSGCLSVRRRATSSPSDLPSDDTSNEWVRRLWTKMLPGRGNTCVLFCKRRKGAE